MLEGRFRQDLLYRINTIEIRLPPLRERVDDIPLLTNYYLEHFNHKYKLKLSIAPTDMQILCRYTWPGNVRELAHAIERAVVLSDSELLDVHLMVGSESTNMNTENGTQQLEQLLTNDQYDTFNLEVLEQRTVRAALKHHHGIVSHAAKALGLTRGAIYRRLEKYDL